MEKRKPKRIPKEVGQMMAGGKALIGVAYKLLNAFLRLGGLPEQFHALEKPEQAALIDKMAKVAVDFFRGAAITVASATVNAVSNILTIDRTALFNPEFLGKNWTIWRGPTDGNGLEGEEDQDQRSLALTEVDLNKILLETFFRQGEVSINGEEKIKRLKEAGCIKLDAKVFLTLWQNKHLIPEKWKGKYVYFDGTVFRNPDGYLYVLSLYWRDGQWSWHYRWLGYDWHAADPSAVLASI